MSPYLVTGAAGFIGFHVARRLLDDGGEVLGVDSVNDYYDPGLKEARLDQLRGRPGWTFERLDLADREATEALFARHAPRLVIHLAAQAGVRYSLTDPHAYTRSNVTAFLHVLEGCRQHGCEHLLYASSSSVYGANTAMPFSEHHPTGHPISLYAATKRANELMAHSYAHLYRLPCTGLRFFTVYGPWGRPDMALFLFARAMLAGRPIDLFNRGDMLRDFTYVDDVVEGVVRLARQAPPTPDPTWRSDAPDPATSTAPWRLYNVGHNDPVHLMDLVRGLEAALGVSAKLNLLPMQPGDVHATFADASDLARDAGYAPGTPVEEGTRRFVEWYLDYYGSEGS